eukprot:GHVQ01025541.1.p1 GENE.GHVQ01025541.1~~GHVQ01025541.1.p1  ORF type:complete len:169 (-),score=20.11 GHVQ01025541.1:307-813(-)
MAHFGYNVSVLYPPLRPTRPLYERLLKQLEHHSVRIISDATECLGSITEFDLVVDAMFGFSFRGPLRDPYDKLVQALVDLLTSQQPSPVVVVSVDVPSGWNVDTGPPQAGPVLYPDMNVSLTAPKACMATYRNTHYIGGRFLPESLAAKYGIDIPPYPGHAQIVKISE